jgi:type VI protein secretion system component VasF
MRAMEQAPSASGGEGRVAKGSSLADTWDAWEEYYKKASLRRRSQGNRHQHRFSKRRRRIRERLALIGSAAGMGILMLIFYLVLSHH